MRDEQRGAMNVMALVTGGTSGIGAATAEALARRQWRVVIVGRDRARCESTIARLRASTGNAAVDYLLGDLSSQRGVRRVAEEFLNRYSALHVLVNNAGGLFMNRRESADGIELTLALNHLAPFMLTHLLLDLLRRSEPARIVNVSSGGHFLAHALRRDDLQWRRRWYRGFQAYHQSKLANLLFTYELARRLAGTQVTVNAADPGIVSTNIGADNAWYWRRLKGLIDRALRAGAVTAEQAAGTIVHLATSPEGGRVTGGYFAREKAVPSSPASRDVDLAAWLWAASEELTGISGVVGQRSSQTCA